MAKDCGCAGQSCSCLITAGTGATVEGIGTKASPYVVALDAASVVIGTKLSVNDSPTINLTKTGDGSAGNPIILQADVYLTSPNGNHWTLSVSNAGVLTAVPA